MRLRRSATILLASGILLTSMAQDRGTDPAIADSAETLLEKAVSEDRALLDSAPGAGFRETARGPFPNVQLPAGVVAPEGQVTVFADFAKAEPRNRSVPLYLVNRGEKTLELPSGDGDLFSFMLEFQDSSGRWERAQSCRGIMCANGPLILTLAPGQHFVLSGYLPGSGEPAMVRYRCYVVKGAWISNAGPGFYLPADQKAAEVDRLQALEILGIMDGPSPLWDPIHCRGRRADGPLPIGDTLAVVRLRSIYCESKPYRHQTQLLALDWPVEAQAEREMLRSLLDQRWPTSPQPGALFEHCLAVVSAQGVTGDKESPGAIEPALGWRVIDELLLDPALPDPPSAAKRAFAALDVAYASPSSIVQDAAAALLHHPRLVDEQLTTERTKSWVGTGNLRWLTAISSILVRRGEAEWLSEKAGTRRPPEQLAVLRALAEAAPVPMPFEHRNRLRNPEGEVELHFWKHCARTQPVETACLLYRVGVSGDPPVHTYDVALHEELWNFLATEAKRTDVPAKVDTDRLSRVVAFVGGWKERDDVPLFRDLLRHPGYESSRGSSSENATQFEQRSYLVRAAAKTALMAMEAPVPEGVVLEEKVALPAK